MSDKEPEHAEGLNYASRQRRCIGSGTASRRWVDVDVPAGPPPRVFEVETREIRLATRDGIELEGLLWLPRSPDARFPGIVATNGYAAFDELAFPGMESIASRGYAVALIRLRGVGGSGGATGLYEMYGPDGYDAVEWIASQPFCNGDVGMVGGSLLAASQWFAAREVPPSLKVIVPDDAIFDAYDTLWYPGGMAMGPGRQARAAVPGVASETSLAAAHPWFDDFWRERSIGVDDVARVALAGISVLLTSGWDSYLLPSAKCYSLLRKMGGSERTRVIIGPWSHAAGLTPGDSQGEIRPESLIRPRTGFAFELLWLDRCLKGTTNELDDEPPVLLWINGAEQWRFEENWPLPDERRQRLYLSDRASGTAGSSNDGRLEAEPVATQSKSRYAYDPATASNLAAPVRPHVVVLDEPDELTLQPYRIEFPLGYNLRVQPDKTPYEVQSLTWTSARLEMPVEVTGYPTVSVWARVSRPEADFVFEITEVEEPEPGKFISRQVARLFQRASHHFSREQPTALRPNDIYNFNLEFLPMAHVFSAGRRIRLSLHGAALDPDLAHCLEGPGLNTDAFDITIYSGGSYSSFVELPFIGASPTFLRRG